MIAFCRLVRPGNLLLLAAAILLGRALAGRGGGAPGPPLRRRRGPSGGGLYVLNDIADRSVDRVNRPGVRSLRRVGPRAAAALAIILGASASSRPGAGGPAPLVLLV